MPSAEVATAHPPAPNHSTKQEQAGDHSAVGIHFVKPAPEGTEPLRGARGRPKS